MTMWARFAKAVLGREFKMSGWTWAGLVGALVYTIWPLDIFSELAFPVVGYIDDLGFWGIALMLVGREKGRWEAELSASAIDVSPRKNS